MWGCGWYFRDTEYCPAGFCPSLRYVTLMHLCGHGWLASVAQCLAASVFSRCTQTTPLSQRQEVLFLSFSVPLLLFSQGEGVHHTVHRGRIGVRTSVVSQVPPRCGRPAGGPHAPIKRELATAHHVSRIALACSSSCDAQRADVLPCASALWGVSHQKVLSPAEWLLLGWCNLQPPCAPRGAQGQTRCAHPFQLQVPILEDRAGEDSFSCSRSIRRYSSSGSLPSKRSLRCQP